MPKSNVGIRVPILANLEKKIDPKGLEEMVRKGIIVPPERLSPKQKARAKVYGGDPKRTYLIPVRRPGRKPESIEEELNNRVIISRENGDRRLFQLKGVGSSDEEGKKNHSGQYIYAGNYWQSEKEELPERAFWGGARVGTLNNAIMMTQRIREEIDLANKMLDPSALRAKLWSASRPNLVKPVALFRPLELPVNVWKLDSQSPKGGGGIERNYFGEKTKKFIEKYISKRGKLLVKAPTIEVLRTMGVHNPDFQRDFRILGLEAPEDGMRLYTMDRIDFGSENTAERELKEKFTGGRMKEYKLRKFAASIAFLMHVMHHRLKISGSTPDGSIFFPFNIAPSRGLRGPVFYDFDTADAKLGRGSLDVKNALNSMKEYWEQLTHYERKFRIYKSVGRLRRMVETFCSVYTAGMPRKKRERMEKYIWRKAFEYDIHKRRA